MGNKAEDFTGRKYGKLTVVKLHHIDNGGRRYWECQCECGGVHICQGTDLKLGKVISCGCARKTQRVGADITDKKLADVHHGMMNRCYNKKDTKHYKNYGERGITVCEEWHNLKNFRIWAYANGYNLGLSIDRIDTNGNYEPSNCRWTNQITQANNKRNNLFIEYNGGNTYPRRMGKNNKYMSKNSTTPNN